MTRKKKRTRASTLLYRCDEGEALCVVHWHLPRTVPSPGGSPYESVPSYCSATTRASSSTVDIPASPSTVPDEYRENRRQGFAYLEMQPLGMSLRPPSTTSPIAVLPKSPRCPAAPQQHQQKHHHRPSTSRRLYRRLLSRPRKMQRLLAC